ncbi:MAG: methyltransferase domain-containing protein [Pseudomonadota bacterium]
MSETDPLDVPVEIGFDPTTNVVKTEASSDGESMMTDHERIKKALMLNLENDRINRFYNEWSEDYDADVTDERYAGPITIADMAARLYPTATSSDKTHPETVDTARVLDAGCGTGLVGVALHQVGFRRLTGVDLSQNMVDLAARTNVYETLCGDIDLTQNISTQVSTATGLPTEQSDQFDLTVCVGVFTLGHVPVNVLDSLLSITRPGGLVLATVREEYYEAHGFEAHCDALIAAGDATHIESTWGRYVSEDHALYVALRAAGQPGGLRGI